MGRTFDKGNASRYNRSYRERYPQRIRNHNLRRKGWTLKLFALVMRRQRGRCAISGIEFILLEQRFVHADHCHATHAPRGVLCHHCNMGLGAFRDNPRMLEAAAAYLRSYKVE